MTRLVYPAQMSDACRVALCELCRDEACECRICHGDQLEPLRLTEAEEAAAEVEYDTRARRREASR